MKRYLAMLCALITLAVLPSCDNSEESSISIPDCSVSEEETSPAVEETAPTEEETTSVEEQLAESKLDLQKLLEDTKPSDIELKDRYNGNYMSIGVSERWSIYEYNHWYGSVLASYEDADIGYIADDKIFEIFTREEDYNNFEEYCEEKADSRSYYYTNANSIGFLCRKVNIHMTFWRDDPFEDEDSSIAFITCNNGHYVRLQFVSSFPAEDMLAIVDSFQLVDFAPEVPTESPTEKITEKPTQNSNETLGQQNALKSAKSYIKHSSFSYLELIEQLEYEKYSHDDAVYAADNCGADWNAEALESAKSYINYSGFSYQGLLNQLEHEQFTSEQAQYGVDNCGADWLQEAAECAESYIRYSSFSRDELLDQLLYEGFTQEQAEYGVQSVGY